MIGCAQLLCGKSNLHIKDIHATYHTWSFFPLPHDDDDDESRAYLNMEAV